jgi:hypothetical protein
LDECQVRESYTVFNSYKIDFIEFLVAGFNRKRFNRQRFLAETTPKLGIPKFV